MPAVPPPVAARALAIATSKLGQKEVGGPNQGPIVEWSAEPWTSRHPGPTDWARWCAFFVSTCYLEAFAAEPRGLLHQDPAIRWQGLGSGSCDRLWQHLDEAEATGRDVAAAQPGDLLFFGGWRCTDTKHCHARVAEGQTPCPKCGAPAELDLDHVGLVERIEDGVVLTIEGNSGDAVRRQRHPLGAPLLWGWARPALLLE